MGGGADQAGATVDSAKAETLASVVTRLDNAIMRLGTDILDILNSPTSPHPMSRAHAATPRRMRNAV
jgi:hypothetical protein